MQANQASLGAMWHASRHQPRTEGWSQLASPPPPHLVQRGLEQHSGRGSRPVRADLGLLRAGWCFVRLARVWGSITARG